MGLQQQTTMFDTAENGVTGQVRVTVDVFTTDDPSRYPEIDILITDTDGDLISVALEDFRRIARLVDAAI